MPVLNPSVAPLIVIAPRGASTRAIVDEDVLRDEAIAPKHAYEAGPGHTPSAPSINLTAAARRMQAAGGRVREFRRLKATYT